MSQARISIADYLRAYWRFQEHLTADSKPALTWGAFFKYLGGTYISIDKTTDAQYVIAPASVVRWIEALNGPHSYAIYKAMQAQDDV